MCFMVVYISLVIHVLIPLIPNLSRPQPQSPFDYDVMKYDLNAIISLHHTL